MDFVLLIEVFVEIEYDGWIEIFMYLFLCGILIFDMIFEVIEEIN